MAQNKTYGRGEDCIGWPDGRRLKALGHPVKCYPRTESVGSPNCENAFISEEDRHVLTLATPNHIVFDTSHYVGSAGSPTKGRSTMPTDRSPLMGNKQCASEPMEGMMRYRKRER